MRFLLYSLLFETASAADVAADGVECGTANADAGYCLIAEGACQGGGTTDDNKCRDSGDTKALQWWATDGTVTGYAKKEDSKKVECAYDKDPMSSSSTVKTSEGLFDTAAAGNYEVKVNYVATNLATKVGTTKPTDMAKGYAVLFNGEAFDAALKTSLTASVKGNNDTAGEPIVICMGTERNNVRTLTTAQNKCAKKVDTAKTGRCVDGSLVEDMTKFLNHNAVGDGTKECYHLPWAAAYKAAAACTATQTCDRFTETIGQCVDTAKIMAPYTAATATKKHCMRWDTAGADDKYRHIDAAYSSQECTEKFFCNKFGHSSNSDPICLEHIIGTSAKNAARQPGAAVSATNTALKWCVGVTLGAKQCKTTEVCNPHAATRADLCLNKTVAADGDRDMAFGAVGTAAPAAGTDKRPYCIGDNAAGAVCGAKTVCNYAGGDQSGVAGGDVCLPHTKLLGTIADTAPWTAEAQRKLDGVALKHCLATDGTTFSSKICATTEKCNPHASSTADVCIKGITVLNHGDIAPAAAEVVADSVRACIGKSFWKLCASEDGDTKEVCNEGAAALTDVCIATTDCVNAEVPMEAFREAGVEAAEDQKWCFATNGAAKCGLDTLCNPSGSDGGTNSDAICVDATKSVPHGEAATEDLTYCIGNTGNAVLADDDTESGWLCDQGKGKFIDPKAKMDPRSKNETPDPLPEGEVAVEVCFGKDKVETCDVGVYCNSMGSETGCSDAACTEKNICITEESLIAEGEQFVAEGKSVCLNADATKGEVCTEEKMYCDQTEGVCSAEEIASTDEPNGEGEGSNASGSAAQSLAAAAVVAILSA